MTTITITKDGAHIITDIETAKQLIKKNSRCTSSITSDEVKLHYSQSELNTITSMLKSSKV